MTEFDGKVALVTGTSGIARATALRLAGAGAAVLCCGIDERANAELQEALHGARSRVVAADVSSEDAVREAVDAAISAFGGIDIVVNSAAIHPYGTAVTTDFETWNRTMTVNVGSIFLTAHLAIPHMIRRGGGAIVNVASVQGHACQQNVAAYATTKGAIHALTRALALDHARDGIRVNSVSPGSVRTPILERAARADDPDADIEAAFRRFGAAHPVGRIGEPEEVAELIAFLCSDKAGFITGADYRIDGGLTSGIGVR